MIKKDAIRRLFLCLCIVTSGCLFNQAVLAANNCSAPYYDDTAHIKYIHDGDTLHLRDGRKIRLIGINTPELARDAKPAEPYAIEAKEALKTLFKNDKSISLVFGKDKKDRYGRYLAHAFLADGQNVQATLLKQGNARVITHPPNTKFSSCYLEVENNARCNNRGLWTSTPILDAKRLNTKHTGFQLVSGRVKDIDRDNKGVWLNIDDRLTVGIRTENLSLFDLDNINSLINHAITVRGWLNKSKRDNPFYIRVRHPTSIQLNSAYSCH